MERADEVLALWVLMPVLPPTELSTWASSDVGICTKRTPRRTMARGKAREIADDAAAERDDDVAALEAQVEHLVADLGERRHALGRLAGRQHDGAGAERPFACSAASSAADDAGRATSRR